MRLKIFTIIFLLLSSLVVFWQVGGHEFIPLDDQGYVTDNPYVKMGLTFKSIIWAFTSFYATNWHPLTWFSHMIDVQMFGLFPSGHHLMSLFYHTANSIMLFLVFCRLTGLLWRSAVVAALFALHPLHVESVAWVAERKDVLSGLFLMITLYLYVRYIEKPGLSRYILSLLAFASGLMAKPMLVTLPFVLLLLDYWPLGRISGGQCHVEVTQRATLEKVSLRHLLLEKIPFLVLSAVSCVLTIYAQHEGGAMPPLAIYPLSIRIANALISYQSYLENTFWPVGLSIFYRLTTALRLWQAVGATLLLVIVTTVVFLLRRRFSYLIVGWLWFLGTLLPVIGIVQVGSQAMADRYTYIPLIGVFIIIVWGLSDVFSGHANKRIILASMAGVMLLGCAALSWKQASYWVNSETLFSHALVVDKDNFIAHNQLGMVLEKKGNIQGAAEHFKDAISIDPTFADAYSNLGVALAKQGDLDRAVAISRIAVQLKPTVSEYYLNIGTIFAKRGDLNDAIDNYEKSLQLKPYDETAHKNLEIVLKKRKSLLQ